MTATYTPTYTPTYGDPPPPRIGYGLGNRFFMAGVDVSGDVAALDKCTGSIELLDVTLLRQSAYARTGGLRDGLISFTAYFNPAPVDVYPAVYTPTY